MSNTNEFPTPGYHAKGTKVQTVNGVTGSIVRFSAHGEAGANVHTSVLVESDDDGRQRWYNYTALTVVNMQD